jgi:hypothetical protein
MKLSHLTLGFLILGATVVKAQPGGRPNLVIQDSTKTTKKNVRKTKKKLNEKDSLKGAKSRKNTDPDYCPPCGMG